MVRWIQSPKPSPHRRPELYTFNGFSAARNDRCPAQDCCHANHVVLTYALDSPFQKPSVRKKFANTDGTLDTFAKAVTSQATGAVHFSWLECDTQ